MCVNQYVFVCVSKHYQQEFHNVFLVSMPLLTGILIVPIGHPIREYQNTYMAGTCVQLELYMDVVCMDLRGGGTLCAC